MKGTATVLVTGGAGYVGSHACKALSNAGYPPVVFDNLVRGHRSAVRWGPLEVGSIHDGDRLRAVLKKYQPAAVMHFAAYSDVAESVASPGKYYWNNVAGTLSLLDAMSAAGIQHLVFSSTCSIFGVPASVPMDESHPQKPVNPYGASKMMVERMLPDYELAHGMKAVCLRYFNAAGADPDLDIGECHEPETHLIPVALLAAQRRIDCLKVFGSDYPTSDGTCIRDYVHVADLARAHVLALEYLQAGGPSCGLNLGTGAGSSVREVISAVSKVTRRQIPVVFKERRAGDPPALVACADRAMRLLRWTPHYPELETQVLHAWRWLLKSSADRR